MSFRNPTASAPILGITDTATSGTVLYPFTIPTDSDSIVAKIYLNSTWSAAGSAAVTIQTTEDGGTTWRDVSSTTIGNATVAATMGNQNAHFIPIPCISDTGGLKLSGYVGSVAASTFVLAQTAASVVGQVSGMPMVSSLGRVQITYTSTITTGGINVVIYAPTQEYR